MKSRSGGLRRQKKAKWENLWDWMKGNRRNPHFSYTGGCRRVNNEQLQHMEMVCEGQDNNEGFSGLPLGCLRLCLQGFRKENCSDVVSKVCYPRCTGTVDRAHLAKD